MSAPASAQALAAAADDDAPSCPYCANVKLLREILPPKRCDYCRQWRCQFCTLKFPLLGVRRVLPKPIRGNSRICLQCFGLHWRQNGLSAGARPPPAKAASLPALSSRGAGLRDSLLDSSRRESLLVDDVWAGKAALSGRSAPRLSFLDDAPTPAATPPAAGATPPAGALTRVAALLGLAVGRDATGAALGPAVDLWMSLFSAAMLVVIALADGLSLQQRACFCVATYGLFLSLHPWLHAGRPSAKSAASDPSTKPTAAPPAPSAPSERPAPPASPETSPTDALPPRSLRSLPPELLAKQREVEETVAFYLSAKCPWKQVRRSEACTVSELAANDSPFPVFKLETFVSGLSLAAFMAHIRSTRLADRLIWDVNAAGFEVVEAFAGGAAVCVNTQKAFLGGLVAARDFCLLYLQRPDALIFTSVEHPAAPPRPGATRAHLFLSLFACREGRDARGTPGFTVTNVGQVDVRGSLPTRVLYKGTMDNMENVMKVFRDAARLFPAAKRE